MGKIQPIISCFSRGIAQPDEKILGLNPEYARILIPVLVTLSIFILGILINYTLKKFERKSFLKSNKSLLIIWARLLSTPIKQQSNSCRDFSQRLKNSDDMQPERIKFNVILSDKLLSIELKDYVDTIILNHRGKKDQNSKILFNILNQIEFLELAQKDLKFKYDLYHHDSQTYMEEWNDTYKSLHGFMTKMKVNYSDIPNHPVYPFYKGLAAIFNVYVTEYPKGGNIKTLEEKLLIPSYNFCQGMSITNPQLQEIYSFSLILQELEIVIKKWHTNRDGTSQLFEDIAIRFDDASKVLNEYIDRLDKMKFKWLYLIN